LIIWANVLGEVGDEARLVVATGVATEHVGVGEDEDEGGRDQHERDAGTSGRAERTGQHDEAQCNRAEVVARARDRIDDDEEQDRAEHDEQDALDLGACCASDPPGTDQRVYGHQKRDEGEHLHDRVGRGVVPQRGAHVGEP
jgi:hypothetical protein